MGIRMCHEKKKKGKISVTISAAAGDTARMHTGNRLEGFKPYRPTSTLARMVHAARSAYAHISLTYIHSHTHTTVRLSNVSNHVHGKNALLLLLPPLPPSLPPPCIPLAFCF